MSIRISQRQIEDVTEIQLDGHLVMGEESQKLKQTIAEVVEAGNAKIVMNMAGVAYVDSFGVGELVSGLTTARKSGGSLAIVQPTNFVRDVLGVTHLDSVLPIFESQDEAIASFSQE